MPVAPDPDADDARAAVRQLALDAFARDGGWDDLAATGLLGLSVPEACGGDGLGMAEVAEVVLAGARRASDLPVWETCLAGAPTLAESAPAESRDRWLRGVAAGETVLTPAVREAGRGYAARHAASTTVVADGTVTGRKIGVTHAPGAVLLVEAVERGRPVVAVVEATAPGVTLLPSPSSTGAGEHTLVLEAAPCVVLADGAAERLVERSVAGLVLRTAGLVAGALELTAAYVGEREQFGRRLAEFQAVAQQIADVYVASRTLDLAAGNAVWRVGAGLPAADDLAVAAYWACVEAPAALHTCHHLHGGVGVDRSYPLHRYYSQVADAVHALGGVAQTAEGVGAGDLAAANLELTEEQRALKARLRRYFAGLATPEEQREVGRDRHGPDYQRTVKQLGQDGWLGVGWPVEHGGRGLGEIEQTIFANEAQRADVQLPAVTLQTVGPTLMRYGTAEQKAEFLPRILSGEVHFAIGYSEPEAGTDLAALRTTARREGDHYVVNGQKLWTTGGHQADYVWLAARTDPEAARHRGLSILIVDTRDPGYSWTPIITADGSHHVNATFYSDVRVPVSMRVGAENDGWRLITTQLNHERVMLGPAGRIEGLRDRVLAWSVAHGVADRADVRAIVGEATAAFRVNELLNWEVARSAEAGRISVADASASKVFAADRVQALGRALAEVVHRYGDPAEPDTARLVDYLDAQAKRNLVLTFGGGVTEVQKELISMFGLGLPRVPR